MSFCNLQYSLVITIENALVFLVIDWTFPRIKVGAILLMVFNKLNRDVAEISDGIE